MSYNRIVPGVLDNLAFLNLHFDIRDSYIIRWMSGLIISVEGRSADCGYPPSIARRQNCRNRHFGVTYEGSCQGKKNTEVRKSEHRMSGALVAL